MITTNYNFILSSLTSIIILSFSSSTLLSKWYSFSSSTPLNRQYSFSLSMPLSKRYVYLQVGRVFCCNRCMSGMI